MFKFIRNIVLSACCGVTLAAATIHEVRSSAEGDLRAALDELAALQKQIGDEKIPLARQANELEEKLADRRKELERAQRSHENQLVDLNVLKAEVKRLRDENGLLASMLSEYGRVFETRIHISEVQRHKAAIDAAKLAAAAQDLSGAEKFERQIELVKASIGRAEGLLGGDTFHGQALAPSGRIETGKFALIGPVAIFASDKSEAAGLVELQLGSPEPTVVRLEPAQNVAIRTLATSGSGELPLDASGGSALKIAATRDGFLEHIVKGGVVMIPIILLAVAAAIVGLIKWIQLARLRVASPKDLQIVIDHLNTGHADRAKLHAKSISGPSGELLAIAVEHAKEKKELIEEMLYEKMLHFKPRLERTLPFLALTAAAAPLLGLLGTVTGMISTFNMISVFGTGDPRTLSGGISEALITTEWGLLVAIPALLLHAVLARRVKGILAGLEQLSVGFINGVPDHEETLSFE